MVKIFLSSIYKIPLWKYKDEEGMVPAFGELIHYLGRQLC